MLFALIFARDLFMKKICLILMLSILSVSCSGDPRELVIPQDTSEIDQFSEKVKSLGNPPNHKTLNLQKSPQQGVF